MILAERAGKKEDRANCQSKRKRPANRRPFVNCSQWMSTECLIVSARCRGYSLNTGMGDSFLFQGFQARSFHVPHQAKSAQDSDGVPVHINFIPGQPMPCRLRMSVMIVVPAFAIGEQRHP